jgi:serine-threonine kinase receptor-associated protein
LVRLLDQLFGFLARELVHAGVSFIGFSCLLANIGFSLLVVATLDGTISWWNLSSSSPTKVKQLKVEIPFMQLEKKGDILLVAAANSAYVLDSTSGEITRQIDLDYKISAFALNIDRNQFLTGTSEDTWVRLHDYTSTDLLGK